MLSDYKINLIQELFIGGERIYENRMSYFIKSLVDINCNDLKIPVDPKRFGSDLVQEERFKYDGHMR